LKNITISVDDETYDHARRWAINHGTSISAIVKCVLVTLPLRSPSPPTPARPAQPGNASIQAVASEHASAIALSPSDDVVLIPACGLTALRATLLCVRRFAAAPQQPAKPRTPSNRNKL
jgi:hypothetical protein